jgi:hypothetical protein
VKSASEDLMMVVNEYTRSTRICAS